MLGMLHLSELQDTGWANLRPLLHCSPLQTSMHGACTILQQTMIHHVISYGERRAAAVLAETDHYEA